MTTPTIDSAWPDGLTSFRLGFLCPKDELNFDGLAKELSTKGVVLPGGDSELLLALRGSGAREGMTGLLRVKLESDQWDVDLDIVRTNIALNTPNPIELNATPSIIGRHCPGVLSRTVAVFGVFRLRSDAWRPAVRLPVTVPGVLDGVSGQPEVSGFEFTFKDPEFPLRVAEISSGANESTFSVTEIVRVAFADPETLLDRGASTLGKYLSFLAIPVASASIPHGSA
jgi:hypothetical protein